MRKVDFVNENYYQNVPLLECIFTVYYVRHVSPKHRKTIRKKCDHFEIWTDRQLHIRREKMRIESQNSIGRERKKMWRQKENEKKKISDNLLDFMVFRPK